MEEKFSTEFYQEDNIKYLKNVYGTEAWTTVCGHKELNGADIGFWCGFIQKEYISRVLTDYGWDMHIDSGGPGFEGGNGLDGYVYRSSLLDDGLEPLLFYREFFGVADNYVEISQEFILLNNLRYDTKTKSYWAMCQSGEAEEAVKYQDNCSIQIKTKYLRKYAAAKQLCILLFFDSRIQNTGDYRSNGIHEIDEEHENREFLYGISSSDNLLHGKVFSRLLGKKIVYPVDVQKCGFWPFEKEPEFEEFIIGIDDMGDEIKYTCNPDKLGNYFGANPEAPMYLTPVFFKKEVLQKYIAQPEKYEIRDGYLGCGQLWGIEIDNHHKNCISVYLGDLGRDLPACERPYWKSYNIVGEEPLSKVSLLRDFMNIPAESEMADHQFHVIYRRLNNAWEEKYHWPLFLPLADEDQYNLHQIRIPLTDSQSEFDTLVLALVKVLIDSLNEKEFGKVSSDVKALKGISKLEKWIELNSAESYKEHIQFLRNLQELRSTGTGHRKGKSYSKIAEIFEIDEKNLMSVFEEILLLANGFMGYMYNTFVENN